MPFAQHPHLTVQSPFLLFGLHRDFNDLPPYVSTVLDPGLQPSSAMPVVRLLCVPLEHCTALMLPQVLPS